MRISIFGLGYVGSTSAACLAALGHEVIGVDVNSTKVDMINVGHSPVIEANLETLISQMVSAGRLQATTNTSEAIITSQASLVCVGTPSNHNGGLDLTFVKRVCQDIGAALAAKGDYHVVVLRSTVLPGTTEEQAIPTLERASGRQAGRDFGVCFNPEFLREGSSVRDFHCPPFTLIGAHTEQAGQIAAAIYQKIDAPLIITSIKVAEMVKYVSNAFHALKVTFANEIGNICKQQNIDSHQVMNIFCRDKKLNISSAYLKPGFAFGGSCLPKDLRALLYHSRHLDLELPVLENILRSNQNQIKVALRMIQDTGKKRVGILGLSFKAGTDDLRESPLVELIERLIGKGYQVRVYDQNVSLARLHGANRAYIEREIPHIANLMTGSVDEILQEADVIVIGNKAPEFAKVLTSLRADQTVIDLVRISDGSPHTNGTYKGICW